MWRRAKSRLRGPETRGCGVSCGGRELPGDSAGPEVSRVAMATGAHAPCAARGVPFPRQPHCLQSQNSGGGRERSTSRCLASVRRPCGALNEAHRHRDTEAARGSRAARLREPGRLVPGRGSSELGQNTQANKELIRCVILSRIIFGEEHWKCAQALASLAYGYLTLRGLPAQAKKHADSAKNTLLTWKENTTSDKEKKEIVEALVMLYYTLGVAWLLQNQYPFLPSWVWVGCVPSIFLDCFTGKEAYFNLQKSDRNMKELKESYKGGVRGLQVSEKDLMIALGRASLVNRRLNLALAYFEKAVGNVIAAKGDRTSDLVILYEEIAQIEQLRRNHEQAIQYLQQAHSICVSLFTEVSPQAAEASALLAKAYAMSGEAQHRGRQGHPFQSRCFGGDTEELVTDAQLA
ncbi:tetratricopeptide repeat protein 23-like protein [Camelus ferus]|nr:tetratricopeptide repeat protein 23-like protein [Camelus ferus]